MASRMHTLPPIAFAVEAEQPALEIRVNFGMFAGREATPAELDELARELVPEVPELSIVSELRHEVSEGTEAEVHQVRIDVDEEHLPEAPDLRDALTERLVATAERWANACIADRHIEIAEL
jgi:hypothetical protein